jgi:CBS domain-containing protein
MTEVVLAGEGTTTIAEAASRMAQRRVGSFLVMNGERLAGIFTERDIVRAISQDAAALQAQIAHWMTPDPRTISPDASLEDALDAMVEGNYRHLPVTDGDRLVGMLSMRDVSRQRIKR